MDVLKEDTAEAHSLAVLNQPADRAEADRFQALVWDFAKSKTRAGWMRVLLTDGRVAGEVVQIAQMPVELGKMKVCDSAGCATRKLAPRTTVVGILWRSAEIQRLAKGGELALADGDLLLVGRGYEKASEQARLEELAERVLDVAAQVREFEKSVGRRRATGAFAAALRMRSVVLR